MLKHLSTLHFKILFVLCFVSVSCLALMPLEQLPSISSYDKGNHFIAFLVLTGLFCSSFPLLTRWFVLAWLMGYGLVLELLQGLTSFRTFSYLDMLADAVGIGCGLLIHYYLKRFKVI